MEPEPVFKDVDGSRGRIMTRSLVRARVKPEILTWARESAGFDLDEVASVTGFSKVAEWESGELRPTINQLRALARKYKRPLAVFYLHEPPVDFQAISDFRRRPGEGMKRMSAQLHLQVRAAQERREIALDLLSEVGEAAPKLGIAASLDDNTEETGDRLRNYLAFRTLNSVHGGIPARLSTLGVWPSRMSVCLSSRSKT